MRCIPSPHVPQARRRPLWSTRLATLSLLVGGPALGAPPPNDDWDQRTTITLAAAASAFNDTLPAIGEATSAATDPQLSCRNQALGQPGNTVWYRLDLSAARDPLYLSIDATGYDSVVAAYTGTPGSFEAVTGACNDDGGDNHAARLRGMRLLPGREYSILVARSTAASTAAALNFQLSPSPIYRVTKLADTLDGSCDADCSVREAISASNVQPGAVLLGTELYELHRTGVDDTNANGDLDVLTGMGIYGVQASTTEVFPFTQSRVFDLGPGPAGAGETFHLASLELGGAELAAGMPSKGGCIQMADSADHLGLDDIRIDGCFTRSGGGAIHAAGSARIERSHIYNAGTSGPGGALYFGRPDQPTGHLRTEVVDSLIEDNGGFDGGGGIYARTDLVVRNTTIANNGAGTDGGGILSDAPGRLTLVNTTIVGNEASDPGAAQPGVGGGVMLRGTGASIVNSVIAGNLVGNTPWDCARQAGVAIVPALHNRVGAVTTDVRDCAFPAADQNSVGEAGLGTLADNGGPHFSYMPQPGSALIDAGDALYCPELDQRGQRRPQDGDGNGSRLCDIGAVEVVGGDQDLLLRDSFE